MQKIDFLLFFVIISSYYTNHSHALAFYDIKIDVNLIYISVFKKRIQALSYLKANVKGAYIIVYARHLCFGCSM